MLSHAQAGLYICPVDTASLARTLTSATLDKQLASAATAAVAKPPAAEAATAATAGAAAAAGTALSGGEAAGAVVEPEAEPAEGLLRTPYPEAALLLVRCATRRVLSLDSVAMACGWVMGGYSHACGGATKWTRCQWRCRLETLSFHCCFSPSAWRGDVPRNGAKRCSRQCGRRRCL